LSTRIKDYVEPDIAVYSGPSLRLELQSLKDKCLLSLGQLYLQLEEYDLAFSTLEDIKQDSVFSDQALFAYAVAATNLDEIGIALQALNLLKDRPSFTPWLQQVPYALAYLYEQLQEPELALLAYRAAVGHYRSEKNKLKEYRSTLTESTILKALNLESSIGGENLEHDAYGLLKIVPNDFDIVTLLATESFQREISELHELYKLKRSLSRWSVQLDSFDEMMATRKQLRQLKITQTNDSLDVQNVDLWLSKQEKFAVAIAEAVNTENYLFFLNEEQLAYAKKIKRVRQTLALMPKGKKRDQQTARLRRIQSYFDWWASDQYSVNRWYAQKQLRQLDIQISKFQEHYEQLENEMSSSARYAALVDRIQMGRAELQQISSELTLSLIQVQSTLLRSVRQSLSEKIEAINIYLLTSKEAQTRLADLLFRKENNSNMPLELEEPEFDSINLEPTELAPVDSDAIETVDQRREK
jgi:hypothetical protein